MPPTKKFRTSQGGVRDNPHRATNNAQLSQAERQGSLFGLEGFHGNAFIMHVARTCRRLIRTLFVPPSPPQ